MNDRFNPQRRGFGFVNFADPSAADKAIKDKNHFINGHKVLVDKWIAKLRSKDGWHVMTKTLYVYQIPQHVSSDELATFFGEYGEVNSCRIQRDEHYGSIDFESDKTVDDILAANGNWINFRGRFMLEISKHIIRRHLNNDNRSREGGDLRARNPHQTAAYSPARYGSAAHRGRYGGQKCHRPSWCIHWG
ncbi:hypothetical protein PIB30_028201 [Stylosanthes scabra]|uniref:RRM domain-containing protein n=1 Tax=Stylosanthes scabra TaxID=79078 RepID=A0ABU6SAY4_9FABA|nr:hypothetical protein [Stylosanthes scabra]